MWSVFQPSYLSWEWEIKKDEIQTMSVFHVGLVITACEMFFKSIKP